MICDECKNWLDWKVKDDFNIVKKMNELQKANNRFEKYKVLSEVYKYR